MTQVEEELKRHTTTCEQAGVRSARLCVEEVMASILGCPRLLLPEVWSRELSRDEADRLANHVARLANGEPLQYVVGDVNFYGYRLAVSPEVLIPRPETEELVHAALALPVWERGVRVEVVDVGTGSGCIAIAVAMEREHASVLALDQSPGALAVAQRNVDAHGLAGRIVLRAGDLLSGMEPGSADLVVSNPPYVSEKEFSDLEPTVREYEPTAALAAGKDGLDVYRRLIPQARRVLRPQGWILLEIGAGQGRAVESLLKDSGFGDILGLADVNGLDRMVQARCG